MVQPKLTNQILHFTSYNVLESIIKDDGLHFWASRYDCMNDPLEYKWLYEPLKEKIGSNNIVVFLTIQYYCLSLRHE